MPYQLAPFFDMLKLLASVLKNIKLKHFFISIELMITHPNKLRQKHSFRYRHIFLEFTIFLFINDLIDIISGCKIIIFFTIFVKIDMV